jgi:CrcB protein
MQKILFLSIGAVAGALLRYGIGVWMSSLGTTSEFPWATFLINITGSLVLGFLMPYLTGTATEPYIRLMLTTGFCGAYTTMSTFSYETMTLMMDGRWMIAGSYLFATSLLCPVSCILGYQLALRVL